MGLALVAPRRAFAVSDELAGKGGLSDALALLALKLVCVELPLLVLAAWSLVENGLSTGLAHLGRAVQEVGAADLLLLFGAGLVITIGAGRKRAPARDFDLGAVAWLPWFAIDVAARLVVRLAGARPSRAVTDAVSALALALVVAWTALAIRHARRRA